MLCSLCNGEVTWRGPLIALTHTQCGSCGEKNCQVVADEDDDERIIEPQNEWCDDCHSYTHRAGNPCGASLLAANAALEGRALDCNGKHNDA